MSSQKESVKIRTKDGATVISTIDGKHSEYLIITPENQKKGLGEIIREFLEKFKNQCSKE